MAQSSKCGGIVINIIPFFSGSAQALWTPAEITTAAWFDAADSSTITISTGVSQWDDKSGNARNATQGTGSLQPSYQTGVLNGLNIVRFDGTDDRLSTSSFALSSSVTFAAVAQLNSAGSYPMMYVADPFNFRCVSTSGRPALTGAAGNNGAGESAAAPDGTTSSIISTWSVITTVYDLGSWEIWQDGSSRDTFSQNLHPFSSVIRDIGSRGTANYFPGDIAEIVEVPAVSTTDRQLIEGYLAWKWGLEANLPMGHPYKDAPPYV